MSPATESTVSDPKVESTTAPVPPQAREELRSKTHPLPGSAAEMRILWVYAVPLVLIHVLACAVFVPALFSWTGFWTLVIATPVVGLLGINLCYHRLLAHRSLTVPKWFERVLTTIALWSLEDTPGRWVAIHRMHHNLSDEVEDPHSPFVNFLWSHFGWLIVKNNELHHIGTYQKYARDVISDPFYMRLERSPLLWVGIYASQAPLFYGLGVFVSWLWGGSGLELLRMGMSTLVWGMFARTVAVWHITWSVNSLTHLFGYRTFETSDNSRNNWLVGLFAMGEGWHNNHHADMAAASVQVAWWEIDLTYYVIKLLEWVGLATNVVPQRRDRARRRADQSIES